MKTKKKTIKKETLNDAWLRGYKSGQIKLAQAILGWRFESFGDFNRALSDIEEIANGFITI